MSEIGINKPLFFLYCQILCRLPETKRGIIVHCKCDGKVTFIRTFLMYGKVMKEMNMLMHWEGNGEVINLDITKP